MMITIDKLKDLWNNRKTLPVNQKLRDRADQIYGWLDWANQQTLTDSMMDQTYSAKGDGCPTNDSREVFNALVRNQTRILGAGGEDWVGNTWNVLARIQYRDRDCRTASEAAPTSAFENFNTEVNQYQNPDSWFFSFNYPWHIVQWMKTPDVATLHDAKDDGTLRYKFILKYLWMLSDPSVVAILSIRSFYELEPLFRELDDKFCDNFSFNRKANKWRQDIDAYKVSWKKMSTALQGVIWGENAQASDEDRRELSRFLYEISLSDSSVQDGLTMLQQGNKALIMYGPPGTGKTREAKILACRLLGMEDVAELPAEQVRLVQFHPGYSYQDFMGGITPRLDGAELGYRKSVGVFKKLCEDAAIAPGKIFVLIIDEINRADLSSVFGELLFGLEYRGETIRIPWCGDVIEFEVPANVYLIGTMNTTDKSLVGFDLALRRRFSFLKLMPEMSALNTQPLFVRSASAPSDGTGDIDVTAQFVLRANDLNDALGKDLNLSRDKQIGQAYFLKLKNFCLPRSADGDTGYLVNSYSVEKLWMYHIEPLLEEYLGVSFDAHHDVIQKLRKDFCASFDVEAE